MTALAVLIGDYEMIGATGALSVEGDLLPIIDQADYQSSRLSIKTIEMQNDRINVSASSIDWVLLWIMLGCLGLRFAG